MIMKKFVLSACALFGLLATAAAQSDTVNVKLLERCDRRLLGLHDYPRMEPSLFFL